MVQIPSLKKNAAYSMISQIISTIVGLIILPQYLKYLGAEAYGLIGFYTILQTTMQMLDIGMSPALSRELSRFRAGCISAEEVRSIIKSLVCMFLIIGIVVGVALFGLRSTISQNWLNVSEVPVETVETSISLMIIIIVIRFIGSLYRSALSGLEAQVQLSLVNIVVIIIRYLGSLFVMTKLTNSIVAFFLFQLFTVIIEVLVCKSMLGKLIPVSAEKIKISFQVVTRLLPFALRIAYTTGIYLLYIQVDKIVLSHTLSLKEYGYLSLIATITNGILQVVGPITQVFAPRLTYYHEKNQTKDLLNAYHDETQAISVISCSVTVILGVFSKELIFAWTGNVEVANFGERLLFYYALGTVFLSLGGLQYALQFAKGNLRIHVISSTLSAIVSIPVIYYFSKKYGPVGSALAYAGVNGMLFIIVPWIVHENHKRGLNIAWLVRDVVPFFVSGMILSQALIPLKSHIGTFSRPWILLTLFGFGVLVLVINIIISSTGRRLFLSFIRRNVR